MKQSNIRHLILIFMVLTLTFTGCRKEKESMKTTIDTAASHFMKDNLIQINQLPWEVSSENAKELIGEIEIESMQNDNQQLLLISKDQLTFTDLGLTTSVRCYYFDEKEQLYNVWYNFSFPDREQAKQKMDEVVEYFKEALPTSFEYKYNESSRTVLIDYVTLDKFDIPMASWFDETGAQLRLTVEPDEKGFSLHIKLASNRNGHTLF